MHETKYLRRVIKLGNTAVVLVPRQFYGKRVVATLLRGDGKEATFEDTVKKSGDHVYITVPSSLRDFFDIGTAVMLGLEVMEDGGE